MNLIKIYQIVPPSPFISQRRPPAREAEPTNSLTQLRRIYRSHRRRREKEVRNSRDGIGYGGERHWRRPLGGLKEKFRPSDSEEGPGEVGNSGGDRSPSGFVADHPHGRLNLFHDISEEVHLISMPMLALYSPRLRCRVRFRRPSFQIL